MSRSRPSRCLLLAVMLAALARRGLRAASVDHRLPRASRRAAPTPTCRCRRGWAPRRPWRSPRTGANQTSDAGLAAHRLDLSRQVAAIVHAADAGLAVHRLDLSAPAAAASAQPACLPTCGSASVAPRVTPVSPSARAKANA